VNGEQAISMKMNSERNREARLNQIASDSEQKKAEDAHTLVNSALTEIYAAAQEKNPVAAMNKIYTKLLQDPTYKNTLDPSEYQNLLNTAQRLGSTGGFSTTTDGAFANEIVVKAAKGQLTMNDVLEFKETHSITQEDFRLALSMVPSPGDGGSGGSTGFFGDNQMLGRYYDSLKASLVPKNSISGIFDPQIEADFDKIFGELALQYMYKNGGQRPTPAEFEEIFSKPMTEMLGKNTANPTKKDYNYVSAEEEMGNRQAKARDSKIYDGVTQAFNDGLTREQVTAEMDQQGISVEERKHALTQFGVDYVKNQVAKGTKVKDIRKNLRAMGYRDDEIDYYFRRNGVK
jgi:hypothetical protein